MSSFDACKRCGRYVWNDDCRCVLFQAAIPWKGAVDESDWTDVYEREPEYAAEKFAERYDCDGGDYTIIRNGDAEVWVRDAENVITKWDIVAESVPEYSATLRPEGKTGATK